MQTGFQMEYQINGVPSVFEFFLFVNPLGVGLVRSGLQLLQSTDKISAYKNLQIIVHYNHQMIEDYLRENQLSDSSLSTRNKIYHKLYWASLAFFAATLQGQRIGRDFLFNLQREVAGNILSFDKEKLEDIVKQTELDFELFQHDVQSDFVKQLFFKKQHVAREMNVSKTPTLMIIEHQSGIGSQICKDNIREKDIFGEIDAIISDYLDEIQQTSSPISPRLKLI